MGIVLHLDIGIELIIDIDGREGGMFGVADVIVRQLREGQGGCECGFDLLPHSLFDLFQDLHFLLGLHPLCLLIQDLHLLYLMVC